MLQPIDLLLKVMDLKFFKPIKSLELGTQFSINSWQCLCFVTDARALCTDCGAMNSLVYYLCLAFGILFLVMLIVNVYLCCAMTSSSSNSGICCFGSSKESVSTTSAASKRRHHHHKNGGQKDDNQVGKSEDFDPYARSWHGSQYGSR